MSATDRSSLEQERDHLLKSMDDLEAERAAGDIDDADFEQLMDDYTVRTANVLRQLEPGTGPARSLPTPSRRWSWIVGLAGFAILLGLLLARTVGERGVNDLITGSIDESPRQQVLRCQQMGQDNSRLLESLECFDEVLLEDPQNVEALTYRGWYVYLVSRNAEIGGASEDAAELLGGAARSLDRAVDVDPGFPDARAFRAIVAERLGETEVACAELAALDDLNPPPMILGLTDPLADRLAC